MNPGPGVPVVKLVNFDGVESREELHRRFEAVHRELEIARQKILESEERVAMLQRVIDAIRNERQQRASVPGREDKDLRTRPSSYSQPPRP